MAIIDADFLARAVKHAITWHDRYARKPANRFRERPTEGAPYGIHPVWAAMTILHERALPEDLRHDGALALAYHDVLEDTTKDLPRGTPKRVCEFVRAMTFNSFDEERELLWNLPPEIRLLKLYDKVSNFMDGEWMYPNRRLIHREHLNRLVEDVGTHWGNLNIVIMAQALLEHKWP